MGNTASPPVNAAVARWEPLFAFFDYRQVGGEVGIEDIVNLISRSATVAIWPVTSVPGWWRKFLAQRHANRRAVWTITRLAR